ncbi:MAG: V-type ATP synthase subunit D [Deltaproteobacteria bacterium]|nr:V-type ATP synthase subunit D [Deltaproteobacteria bacterium]
MPRMTFNKSALHKEREALRLYERVLPSLDLKRMQLTSEQERAKGELEKAVQAVSGLRESTGKELPMLADAEVDISGLVKVAGVRRGEENVVGVRLPTLDSVEFDPLAYSLLAKPHWVDSAVARLKQMVELRLREQVAVERERVLEKAVRRITQRVNLFEKILIPTAKKNIKKIQIFLADAERAAVVRSKITKAIQQGRRKALLEQGGGS